VHKMNILMSAAVAVACSSTPLLAQTQPAVPAAPPAMTQPTPLIPPDAQPQTPATAQPVPRPTMPPQTPTVGQPQVPVAAPSPPAPVGPPPQVPGSGTAATSPRGHISAGGHWCDCALVSSDFSVGADGADASGASRYLGFGARLGRATPRSDPGGTRQSGRR